MAAMRARPTRGDRHMFSSSDDNAMMKNILATHAPDGTYFDVKPLLQIIEDITHRANPDTGHHGTQPEIDAIVESVIYSDVSEMLEAMALTINKVSCEISCKCIAGADAHATTTGIFHMLSHFGWDVKAIITLAAFMVNYGEFWLVVQLCASNPLAKSLAHLKQMHDVLERGEALKPRFEAVTNLIKAMLELTHCIVRFKDLPEQYISPETPELVTATAHIPTAVYWIIRSIVACASILINLIGMGHEHITTTTEAWELSSLAHKISNIHDHLKHQLDLCNNHISENIEVIMQICLQGDALLPVPIEEEFIDKVKDAVGFILSWPRHLVIRCSDLEKVVPKVPMGKYGKRLREIDYENGKDDEQPTKQEDGKEKDQPRKRETGKEKIKKRKKNDEIIENKKEKGEGKENEKVIMQKKMTRARRNTRIRIEKSGVLKMITKMADAKFSKVEYIKLECEDDLFGHKSRVCLTADDFERVFTLQEITGIVIITYMMHLFEQINKGSKKNHGICFVSPTAASPRERKSKLKNIDDSSRMIANRLLNRKDNDIILIPYNPGNHWVLAVLHMKTLTCYYLDSLRPGTVNLQLQQIVNGAMNLYGTQSGSRVKLNWVNARCPCQPGSTECGYFMLKFMEEIVDEGIKILVNDNVGGGNNGYTDADIDGIREEWSTFVASFMYQ